VKNHCVTFAVGHQAGRQSVHPAGPEATPRRQHTGLQRTRVEH
jgi:hypothetical protein